MSNWLLKLAREPIVQFAILGAVVFAVDHYVFSMTDNPRRIVIDGARYQELVDIFVEGKGRQPTAEEMGDLMVQWSQNEIFYREALSMGLDKGDDMFRQRLILKMRNVVLQNIIVEPPGADELEAWFLENRDAYDRPELVTFEQFLLNDADRSEATALATALGSGDPPAEYAPTYRIYENRPIGNLDAVFGPEHAAALAAADMNRWVAVTSEYGWHLARITERQPPIPATFEKIRHVVGKDYLDYARDEEVAKSMQSIAEQYEVSYDIPRDMVEQSLASADTPETGSAGL